MTDPLEIGSSGTPASPAAPEGAPPPVRTPLALSASRAADFRQCPLLYRLKAIDRIPEPKTRAQVLGTVVHSVLEDLYALEQSERAPERAAELVPTAVGLFYEGGGSEVVPLSGRAEFQSEVAALVSALYGIEDPRRFSPAACEQYLVTSTASGTPLHGYLDRVDVAPTGEVRVVDYKTGKPPRPRYQDQAMFQMRFYALMYQRTQGVVPAQLKLIYLRNGSWLTLTPDLATLTETESQLDSLWAEIERAGETGIFPPRTSRLCDWCNHQSLCPAFGGTPPEYPGWPGRRVIPLEVTNPAAGHAGPRSTS
ncbi:RecB family exonuclease [Dietzia natronolimnaea]|uniref:RecB family exonuclease n=1 Tax=Dietzia natronolimnaea TaxID=161920 RepID=UPI001FECF848|nr:RecB family exonuclease [Dietzia natronolimnaea]